MNTRKTTGQKLAEFSAYITSTYPLDLCKEAVDWRRTMKVVSETGEMYDAFTGVLGENPRKGVTHASNDVVRELLDIAISALGAAEHHTGNQGIALMLLDDQIESVWRRAGLDA